MIRNSIFIGLSMLLAKASMSAPVIEQSISDIAKGNIASAIVLSDASLISLGVVNFDPNNIVSLDRFDAGSETSIQRRKELSVYSIPWESDWQGKEDEWQRATFAKFSYINSKQSLQLSDDITLVDKLNEKSYLLFAEQRWKYLLSDKWWLQLAVGAHLIRYENDFDYRSDFGDFQDELDGSLFNTSYAAWMLDPTIELHYQDTLWGNKWQFISRYNYAFGQLFDTDSPQQDGSPNVGRFSNAFIFHYALPPMMNLRNEMRFLFKRIDLTGDAVATMNTNHYYETGLGWIVETPSLSSWLTNVGIGVTVNIDSALSGGSVVLLFNEDI
ncbi:MULTISPECIES: Solitary outer membrane autotransporter beta-barrel domain [unclassified Shewanella]|uniref:Solitary outer membrane autotransporter beta-barrel domain n=1 Tax=unclassified Shewanella TaxID=196818 RepID=UPI000C82B42A|nr:Solitary outer membrane autotransporter beta-barrel domain [Shewanella sp. 10N.286.51.B7]PMG77579.1 hypothetical protein BCU84_10100 [Shewanella sp. 10N.286.51.B7]